MLIYDIPCDRRRLRVADACLDYGLARIQYSAFFGEISANHLEELLQRVRRILGKEAARVEVFPVCEKCLRHRRILSELRLEPRRGRGRPPKEAGEPTDPGESLPAPTPAGVLELLEESLRRTGVEPPEGPL